MRPTTPKLLSRSIRILPHILWLWAISFSPGSTVFTQSGQALINLERGKPQEGELKGGQSHSYQIKLTADHYVSVVVDQRGIDVVVALFDQEGTKLAEIDSPNGRQGPEPISWLAKTSGLYRLQVRSLENDAPLGKYEARIQERRPAMEGDASRINAQRAFAEAETLRSQGTASSLLAATGKYQDAFSNWQAVGDSRGQGRALSMMGVVFLNLGNWQKGFDLLNQAIPLFRSVNDPAGEGQAFASLGLAYSNLGNQQKAIEYLSQAVALFQKAGDRGGEATSLNFLGAAYIGLGQAQKALVYLNQALPIFQKLGDRNGEAQARNNLGSAFTLLGDPQKAIEYFTGALPIFQKLGDHRGEAQALGGTGVAYSNLGDQQKAIGYLNQALPILQKLPDRVGEAMTLNYLGNAHAYLGDQHQAITHFEQAMLIFRAINNQAGVAQTFSNLGVAHSNLGEHRKALDFFNQALPIFRNLGQRNWEAQVLLGIGNAYAGLNEGRKGLEYLNQALAIFQTLSDRRGEAVSHNFIGSAYASLGDQKSAIINSDQALALYQAVGDRRGQAMALINLGFAYSNSGDQRKSIDYFNQALVLFQGVGDPAGAAQTLGGLGMAHSTLGQARKAIEYFNQALPVFQKLANQIKEAQILGGIGVAYSSLDEPEKAAAFLTQALTIFQKLGDSKDEALTLNYLGGAFRNLNEPRTALRFFNQALLIVRASNDRNGEIQALAGIASVHSRTGALYSNPAELRSALDQFASALALARQSGNKQTEGLILGGMGATYRSLGDPYSALNSYNEAVGILQQIGDRSNEASVLNEIAFVYDALGDFTKALESLNRALPLLRVAGNRMGEARTLIFISAIYITSGNPQQALDYLTQAEAPLKAADDKTTEAARLLTLGFVQLSLGAPQKALDYFNEVRPTIKTSGDRFAEAQMLAGIAQVEKTMNNLEGARSHIEEALRLFEGVRSKVTSQELRVSLFSTVQPYYQSYVSLLMQMHALDPGKGFNAAALQANERGRSRSLLELLTEARADIREGVDPKLLERERASLQSLNENSERQMVLRRTKHTEAQAFEFFNQLAALNAQYESLSAEHERVKAEIRVTSPRYAALTQPQPLSAEQIQQLLDKDMLLLEYSLGDERSYLWAVTPSSIVSYELPGRFEIESAAREVYSQLTDKSTLLDPLADLRSRQGAIQTPGLGLSNASTSPTKSALRLSQMLLAPVATQLKQKRLVIIPDGALEYVPFSALPVPTEKSLASKPEVGTAVEYEPLIVQHEIVNLPSASTLAVLRRELKDRAPARNTLAVLADPVFEKDDERVKTPAASNPSTAINPGTLASASRDLPVDMYRAMRDSGLELKISRLPATRDEAVQILALVPNTQSKQALDFKASRETATSPEMAQYRYLHFATHGFLDSFHPENSGIVLSMVDERGNSQDGFLRAHEIFNLKLPAELVVLSACQTGLGKEIRGEGLVGLTRGFMYAGAPRIVVSLWNVNDEATAALMARFYHGMLKDKLRPAAALRTAQISIMKEKRWQSPYYWAAFTLQGEWR